ncbi:hypothetical protein [Shewanella sp. 10N.286.48.B5]|uniref:hypothetical protein n=1 Tax=Shewanella sp. 10N.286.48.B5 TaxID=1880834 RepID=UPI000C8432F4|nr:hypothetical protein [Shewanella sp. 10N.286.48.B5]PMH84725.1 hypothetical protein BCU57_02495 [Shewanella sp. 10N.286.48.B5]
MLSMPVHSLSVLALFVASSLCLVASADDNAPNSAKVVTSSYQKNWQSLKQHQTPEWFFDAKCSRTFKTSNTGTGKNRNNLHNNRHSTVLYI